MAARALMVASLFVLGVALLVAVLVAVAVVPFGGAL